VIPRRILGLVLLAASVGVAVAAEPPSLWIDLPFIAQTKNGCGSAVIAMVMQYWNAKLGKAAPADADAGKIQQALYSPKLQGISAGAMQRHFEQAGYWAFAFAGDWSQLERHIARGRPLIVALQASGPLEPLHYAVVVGIDSSQGYVYLNDPAQQKMLRISRQGFESQWSPTHFWTLLAVPRTAP
jgi:ABC-type bacteriocin/lantibiotic exporter with double-glycine peptidase domain